LKCPFGFKNNGSSIVSKNHLPVTDRPLYAGNDAIISELRNHQSSDMGFVLQQCPTRESCSTTSQTEGGELRTVGYSPPTG
jgi:hypothetical protein